MRQFLGGFGWAWAMGVGMAVSMQAATVTWKSAASGSWNDPTRWDTGAVPTAADDVVITADGTYTVTVNTAAVCRDLTAGGASGTQTISVASGGTLDVARTGALGSRTVFTLVTGGTLTGDGTTTFSGTFTWQAGTMSGNGRTVFASGSVVTVSTSR